MAFIIGTALALLFLDGVWRVLVIVAVALIELFEIFVWLRWRKVKSTTGTESLVGMKGQVVTECRPEGQIKIKGQIWKAHCRDGAATGDEVVVDKVDGLRLLVSHR